MNLRRIGLGVIAGFAKAVLVAGCLLAAGSAEGGATRRIHVVITYTILADMAREVAGEHATVESLVRPGAEIHGYEPSPRDIVRVSKADLVLWNGLNLEAWFERFFAQVRGVPSAVLSEGVEPVPIRAGSYVGRSNPHAWMSPANAIIYVDNIRAALARVDPANASSYAANAAAYAERIRAVDVRLRETLARIPPQRRVLVTSEGAFSYLCRDYGLRELYLWPTNADA